MPWIALGLKVLSLASQVDWAKIGEGEEQRTSNLLDSIKTANNLWLYPRAEHGGPWGNNLGAGKIKTMSPDELRYFIEWRMPIWKKELENKDWGNTVPRVINRYKLVADLLQADAIDELTAKVGCYKDSGIYRDSVAGYPSSNMRAASSFTIKKFQENCSVKNGSNSNGSISNGSNSNANLAGFGGQKVIGVILGLGVMAAAYSMYKRNAEKLNTEVDESPAEVKETITKIAS